ncbi:MAG: hypothetical protein GVY28_09865 [Alphaproteobacteria bacterium]|jgi:hypothetical protein|nr:hypothetical protein [Alphaproteobacteria bacterium]
MLTIEDCIALSELTREEIDAIAEHEHVPEMVAAELGAYLVETRQGEKRISRMIRDDIAHAKARGDHAHAAKLRLVLRHFLDTHHHDR